ncbi:copine [Anaeramoeba flamelloides]|uniref:Copine n=1 Tax=Anaeramoeba flamelloides TaxID=1746091 RepID=A0AAV7ZD40_9EUKA|nr:copine [Anaeramoeba flamelloides]
MFGFAQSEVLLSIRCKNLPKLDTTSDSDPLAVLFELTRHNTIKNEVGRTEVIQNNNDPVFTKSFDLVYYFARVQWYRVIIYEVDEETENLNKHQVIGSIDFKLGDLMALEGTTLTKEIYNINRKVTNNGTCTIVGEEKTGVNADVKFSLRGIKLDKKDLFGLSDPYVVISRSGIENNSWIPFHQTEVIKRTLNPTWKEFSVTLSNLCGGDLLRQIKFTVLDWNRNGVHDLIGSCVTTLEKITTKKKVKLDLIEDKIQKTKKKYVNSGQLEFVSVKVKKIDTFLDYVRGGTQISLIPAVDFTGSNGDFRHPESLHFASEKKLNEYQIALKCIGSILSQYDTSGLFPIYGFGAKINNQLSHCFPLNGNPTNPYVNGVDGMLEAYSNAFTLKDFTLWGPTRFAPIINETAKIARACEKKKLLKYFILLILTDGEITDMKDTMEAIINASDLPISIIIVGIGFDDFLSMQELDADEELLKIGENVAKRDIVQFVPFSDYRNKDIYELANATLEEIPEQMVSYYHSKNIRPPQNRNHLIDNDSTDTGDSSDDELAIKKKKTKKKKDEKGKGKEKSKSKKVKKKNLKKKFDNEDLELKAKKKEKIKSEESEESEKSEKSEESEESEESEDSEKSEDIKKKDERKEKKKEIKFESSGTESSQESSSESSQESSSD